MVVDTGKVRLLREQALGVDIHDVHILLRHIGGLVWPVPPVHQHVVERLVPPTCSKVMMSSALPGETLCRTAQPACETPPQGKTVTQGNSALYT